MSRCIIVTAKLLLTLLIITNKGEGFLNENYTNRYLKSYRNKTMQLTEHKSATSVLYRAFHCKLGQSLEFELLQQ